MHNGIIIILRVCLSPLIPPAPRPGVGLNALTWGSLVAKQPFLDTGSLKVEPFINLFKDIIMRYQLFLSLPLQVELEGL